MGKRLVVRFNKKYESRGYRNFKRSYSRFVTVSVDARLVKLVPND